MTLRRWTVFALASLAIPRSTVACVSSGICGAGAPPNPACQPPIQCQPASCQPGYSCGHYGCARNRARSALTRKDGVVVSVDEFLNASIAENSPRNIYGFERELTNVPIEVDAEKPEDNRGQSTIDFGTYNKLTNPNYLFRQCCEDRRLPDACLPKCHFNTYSKQTLQDMFFKSDACPIEAAADLQYCAAQGRDHVACCMRNGAHTTLAGDKCLMFCDQRANHVTRLDYTFVPCYERFENMKRCFYDEIKSRMEEELRPYLSQRK